MTESPLPWPGYRAAPDRLNLAGVVLDSANADDGGHRPALIGEFGVVTYAELRRRIDSVGAALVDLGLRRSDRLLIKMRNSPEFAVGFLAAVKRGFIPVLVNSALTADELRPVLEQTGAQAIFTDNFSTGAVRALRSSGLVKNVICSGEPDAGEIPFNSLEQAVSVSRAAETSSGEPAFIVYTSGTTGKPKGIVHAHRWIVALGDLNRYRLPPQENDVVMATGEWSFISALGHNLLFPLRNGVAGAVLSGRATPENVLAAVEKYHVTVLHCVATVYRRLLAMPDLEERNLKSLRCAHSTGEALSPATYGAWKRRVGSELYEHYGVSEYQLVIGNGPRHPVKPGSVGKPLPAVAVALLDGSFKPVPANELGQLAISTSDPGLFLGYYNDRERTESAIQNGWYLPGDLAYQDDDGYFFIAGRRDDCFKSRGIFIAPSEIENALQKHVAVVEAAVVPLPDGDIGNRIHAILVLARGFSASADLGQEIRESLRGQIAPYKIPHSIEFASALPKSNVGKILRTELVKPA